MVRPKVVTLALAALLPAVALAAAPATPPAPAARPFETLLPRVGATAPGTYVVSKTALVAVPDDARIPVLLQADVLKGPERSARVGLVVGADVAEAADVRLRVLTASAAKEGARVVADAGAAGTPGPLRLVREFNLSPGDYDVEAVVGYTRPGGDLLVAIGRTRLSVPDIQGGSLAVTFRWWRATRGHDRARPTPLRFRRATTRRPR
jgi:hypothetical protein